MEEKNNRLNKSDLIIILAERNPQISLTDAESVVRLILESIVNSLASNRRVEIRGFGVFRLHYRTSRASRNPKTGESVRIPAQRIPRFKPGKELKHRVNKLA